MRSRRLDEPAFLVRWYEVTALFASADDPEPPE
jgi:hypothetical protein